ncbi:hypothetical protein D3C80_1862440 [compost metagenome]
MYTVISRAISQGPSLRRANRRRSQVLGCCGNSSVRPKRMRKRWLSQINAAANRLQSIRIRAKAKTMGSHSLAGSSSALNSSLARSNSADQRASGLASP